MQTFLPYPDFIQTAQVLDYRRLGKQRVEAYQLATGKWKHHPASKMWIGFRLALVRYGLAMCAEWVKRGYKDTLTTRFLALLDNSSEVCPPWFGGPIHANHRARLLMKNPEFYARWGWAEKPAENNYWPVR